MEKIEITDEYIDKIDAQFQIWATFLNNGLGLLAFTLAIASLGTHSPSINATLSFVVIMLVRVSGSKFFPNEIQRLRKQAKDDQKAKLILDGLDKKYWGFKTNFTKYHLFLFGFIFLMLVMLSAQITKIFPVWGNYVGI